MLTGTVSRHRYRVRLQGDADLSQDKFWEQWNSSGEQGEKPAEEKPASEPGENASGVDADVLAAWLQALPPTDSIAPPAAVPAPAGASAPAGTAAASTSPAVSAGDLSALWPPAAPVDPFAGIHKSTGAPVDSDWDLGFDDAIAAPAAPPTPDQPGVTAATSAPLDEFVLDAGAGASAAPPAAPYVADTEVPAGPLPGPFGPPPPPMAPPPEALEAPPLRLEITTGRRTSELAVRGEALIGRPDATRGIHPEIDLRLDDAVSRRHAKIFVRSGAYVLTDLNSTNGTRHNQQWLQAEVEVPLKAGDEIEVGERTVIRVLEAPLPNA